MQLSSRDSIPKSSTPTEFPQFDNIFPPDAPTPQSTEIPSSPPAIFVETKVTNPDGIAVFEEVPSYVNLNVQIQDDESKSPLQAIQVQVLSNGNELMVIALDPGREYLPTWKVVPPKSSRAGYAALGLSPVHVQSELAVVLFLIKVKSWLNTGKNAIEFFSDMPDLRRHSF